MVSQPTGQQRTTLSSDDALFAARDRCRQNPAWIGEQLALAGIDS
jgi:hypothetical protein